MKITKNALAYFRIISGEKTTFFCKTGRGKKNPLKLQKLGMYYWNSSKIKRFPLPLNLSPLLSSPFPLSLPLTPSLNHTHTHTHAHTHTQSLSSAFSPSLSPCIYLPSPLSLHLPLSHIHFLSFSLLFLPSPFFILYHLTLCLPPSISPSLFPYISLPLSRFLYPPLSLIY